MIINIFGPLIIFVFLFSFGRFLTRPNLVYFVLLSFIILLFYNVQAVLHLFHFSFSILNFGLFIIASSLYITFEFILDTVSLYIILIITIIACGIFLYSIDYISDDPHLIRFMILLYLFITFIFILVSGNNLIILFIGLEGVGICSYLLISFLSTRIQALKAAIKAIFINKIGDLSFLIGVGGLIPIFLSLDFDILVFSSLVNYIDLNIFLFFLVAICAKSAQVGLHTLLPQAIEGPTPVSALIHAATIVTAGIILFIRLFDIFCLNILFIICCSLIGGLTAILSALTALFLFDIKKIIAYSTCSQLGYILVCCSLLQPIIGLNHLINHAFFKALLFLTAGSIIHLFNNEQDVRYLKNIGFNMPLELLIISIGNFCLIGIPFLTGYYSKDIILELSHIFGFYFYFVIYFFLLLAAAGTSLYSVRLFINLFFVDGSNKPMIVRANLLLIQLVLIFLSLLSLIVGYIIVEYFDAAFIEVFVLATNTYSINCELLALIKLIPLSFSILVIIIGVLFSYFNKLLYKIKGLKLIMIHNFYFNEVYNLLGLIYYNIGNVILVNLDKGVFEYLGPTGISKLYRFFLNSFFLIQFRLQLQIIIYFLFIILILVWLI